MCLFLHAVCLSVGQQDDTCVLHIIHLFTGQQDDARVSLFLHTVCLFTGQQDDARMCLSLGLTAVRLGAVCANYTECVELLKRSDSEGKQTVCGARVRDKMTGECTEYNVLT